MKLQKRQNSKSTAERLDRGWYQMMGLKYPIIPARQWKKICQKAYFEGMSDICPCGY